MAFIDAILEQKIDASGAKTWAIRGRILRVMTAVLLAIWTVCVAVKIAQTVYLSASPVPNALLTYLEFIAKFWAGEPVYFPGNLQGFHYLPVMLILGTPLSWITYPWAAGIFASASILFFSFSVFVLARQIAPANPTINAALILILSLMTAMLSLSLLQMQIPMTAAMLLAAAAAMRRQWSILVVWMTLAVALKPLAIVMALLAVAAIPQIRLPLAGCIILLLAAPFAVQDWHYLSAEYTNYVRQLTLITNTTPGEWRLQADISTLLKFLGFDLAPAIRLAIRLLAAIGTLALALWIARERNARATGFALLILSVSYIGLFNPRQENVSNFVVVPAVAALGVLFLQRNLADIRGWIWLALAIPVGTRWSMANGSWAFPGLMVAVWTGLLWLMLNPKRWCDLFGMDQAAREPAAALTDQLSGKVGHQNVDAYP